jgi:DNA-binding IclR family transcriptional regulator
MWYNIAEIYGNKNFMSRNLSVKTIQKPTAVRSVYRAMDILTCLSSGTDTLTEITDCTNLNKPTVYRLLKTLEEVRMVTQDPITHHYYLGPLIQKIASNPGTNHHYLITCAMPELRQLWEATGETVELNIMIGLQYARIYEIPSRYELKVIAGPDPVGPIFVGATAKVLLSQLDNPELKAALKNIKISHVTEHSVTDRAELMAQAQEIRNQGYAISLGERIDGALCISVPVKNYFWPVALSIVGPEMRFSPRAEKTLKDLLLSAEQVTKNIAEFFQEKEVVDRKKNIYKRNK